MASPRPPEFYLQGPGIFVPLRIADLLERATNLAAVRVDRRGSDPEFDAVVNAIRQASMVYRGSVDGSDPRKDAEAMTPSEWMDTEEVATVLNVSSSRVRQELRSGRMAGEKRATGWRIHRIELKHYRAARAA